MCKWCHTAFIFLCLTYFTQYTIFRILPCSYKWQYFILFCGWAVFHYVDMHHIFFIFSPVDGHLDGFLTLETVNNAAMDIGMHVSFWVSGFGFLYIYTAVELLGQRAVLFLVFWETSMPFSTVTVQIYILTNSVQGFPLLHSLTNVVICVLFDDSYFDRYELVCHCGFGFHFPDD